MITNYSITNSPSINKHVAVAVAVVDSLHSISASMINSKVILAIIHYFCSNPQEPLGPLGN